jgi:hypothetical protein
MIHLSLNQQFVLTFKVTVSRQKRIQQILKENGFEHENWARTPFDNIVEFRVKANLSKAHTIKCLLKNHILYE